MPEDRDQKDVLPKKGNVTESPERGLQQWGDETPQIKGQHGDASEGTAERAARITEGQLRKQREEK